MSDPTAAGARAAAHRLASTHGPRIEIEVEAMLQAGDAETAPPEQYLDPIALASLIVTTAGVTWQVYRDLREKQSTPPRPDLVTRQVRTTLRQTHILDDGTEQLINVTVEEVLRNLPPAD